eukprot:GDKI01026768.1.p1 GENE.GDKI01026768.1~~GDKI01026768.1.p1  ORF type:complete len:301 (-),score=37.29 GDKI01026768.1:25-927(-)
MNTPNHFFTGYLLFMFLCTQLTTRLRALWEPFFYQRSHAAAGTSVAHSNTQCTGEPCLIATAPSVSSVSTAVSTARNSRMIMEVPSTAVANVNLAAVAQALEGGFTYYSYSHPMALMCGCFACLPDWMEHLYPEWEHATWSHMLVLAVPFCLLCGTIWAVAYRLSKYRNDCGDGNSFWLPVGMGYICMLSHFVCDICTHQKFKCVEAVAHKRHIYLYPFFADVSFHLDCLFGWSYLTRVVLEWVVYMPVIYTVIAHRWCVYGQNPWNVLGVFSYRNVCNSNLPLWCVSGVMFGLMLYSGF